MDPLNRRELLRLGALSGLTWAASPLLGGLRPARAEEVAQARSLIVLWLQGGPSQLETFDPHPGGKIGGPTKAIATKQKGVQFGADYARLADRADKLCVIRSMVTKEGEHQRGQYLLRTGETKLPTATHPALTAVVAHEAQADGLEIPRHLSILGKENPPRAGYLGKPLDAFVIGDPKKPLPDLRSPVGLTRFQRRLKSVDLLEKSFRRGRTSRLQNTQHRQLAKRGRVMMTSKQIEAFDYKKEPQKTIEAYGDTPFGRGCLVARRLIETGVPAVEVTLNGWDTHVNHFSLHSQLAKALDAGFSALLDDLQRDAMRHTIVMCVGEFGRTPKINPLDGRDHWTRGFSMVLAGAGLRVGQTIGSTDPEGKAMPTDPVKPKDVYATLYDLLGIDREQVFDTPQGRPMTLCQGKPIKRLKA